MKRSRVRFSQAAPPKPQVNHPVGLGFSRLPGADVVARCCWSWPDVPYRNRTDPDRIRARHGSVTPRMVGPVTPTPEFADLLVAETRQPDRCSCPATCICQVDVYLAAGGETRCCGAAEGERKGPREGRGRLRGRASGPRTPCTPPLPPKRRNPPPQGEGDGGFSSETLCGPLRGAGPRSRGAQSGGTALVHREHREHRGTGAPGGAGNARKRAEAAPRRSRPLRASG